MCDQSEESTELTCPAGVILGSLAGEPSGLDCRGTGLPHSDHGHSPPVAPGLEPFSLPIHSLFATQIPLLSKQIGSCSSSNVALSGEPLPPYLVDMATLSTLYSISCHVELALLSWWSVALESREGFFIGVLLASLRLLVTPSTAQ